ncbi:MAG: helix-turn-helix transcriptional regulator, partial [Clostridia bacterium]|nr:helix-turn-helix transcriptional regulator [Clostridia bacterium]
SDAYERLANGNYNIVEINYLFFGAMSRVLKNGELVFFEGGDDLFCKVLIFVDRFYEENITLKSAAKEMGVSYEYLSRMFTKKSGMNFSEFLNTFRLQKATAMLSDKNLSISETGYRCGFGSIRNFNKVFLKYKNCTPSRFRSGLKFTKQ